MKAFAMLNMVGKTTTAVNLAYILAAEYDMNVLLVDADAQGNATQTLMPDADHSSRDGLAMLLCGMNGNPDEIIVETEITGLDLLPASDALWEPELMALSGDDRGHIYGALRNLRDVLDGTDAYDVMIIDCPPNFSAACVSAIYAANSVVIPVLPDAFSSDGMAGLVAQIDGIRRFHADIRVAGCLVTQWHRADVVVQAVEQFRKDALVPVYDTVIRRTDKVLESSWAREPVITWSPFSAAARDYRAWAKELIRKEGLSNGAF